MATYDSGEVCEILGVSQRNLDYWIERGVVSPSVTPEEGKLKKGKGSKRGYTFGDLLQLAVVKRLRETGLPLEVIRKGLKELRGKNGGLGSTEGKVLLTDGHSLFEKRPSGKIVDVLKRQMVLSVIFLDGVKDELDEGSTRILELRETGKKAKTG